MKKSFHILLVIGAIGVSHQANTQNHVKHLPHSHASLEGGAVLMLGDDHFELVARPHLKGLEVFASDKSREAVKIDQFTEIQVTLKDGEKSVELEKSKGSRDSSFIVKLPTSPSDVAHIEIFSKRKNPPPRFIAATRPQSILLKKIREIKAHDPHAGHKM